MDNYYMDYVRYCTLVCNGASYRQSSYVYPTSFTKYDITIYFRLQHSSQPQWDVMK